MNVIWVSTNGQSFNPNNKELGSMSLPLATLQDAFDKILSTNETFWKIWVSPGVYLDSFTIPVDRIVLIEGAFRATIIGDCIFKVKGHLSSVLILRNIGIGKLKIEDADPSNPAEISLLGLENVGCNEITQEGNSNVGISIAGITNAYPFFNGQIGAGSMLYGDIKINGELVAKNTSFVGGTILSIDYLDLQDCYFEHNIVTKNKKIVIRGGQWLLPDLTVTFTHEPGKLILDTISKNSFYRNNINIINGEVEDL